MSDLEPLIDFVYLYFRNITTVLPILCFAFRTQLNSVIIFKNLYHSKPVCLMGRLEPASSRLSSTNKRLGNFLRDVFVTSPEWSFSDFREMAYHYLLIHWMCFSWSCQNPAGTAPFGFGFLRFWWRQSTGAVVAARVLWICLCFPEPPSLKFPVPRFCRSCQYFPETAREWIADCSWFFARFAWWIANLFVSFPEIWTGWSFHKSICQIRTK